MANVEISTLGPIHNLQQPDWVVVLAAGTGGPQALNQLLPQIPSGFPGAIVVVQQMRPGFSRVLVEMYNHLCSLPIYEPEDGEALHAGRILVSPTDSRLTIANIGDEVVPAYSVYIEEASDSSGLMQSRADMVMTSAAQVFGKKCIGVLMTGLGTDGCEGMRAIHNAGGITIAQDEASSIVHALPASAIDAGVVHEVLPLWSIADRIIDIVGGGTNAVAA